MMNINILTGWVITVISFLSHKKLRFLAVRIVARSYIFAQKLLGVKKFFVSTIIAKKK